LQTVKATSRFTCTIGTGTGTAFYGHLCTFQKTTVEILEKANLIYQPTEASQPHRQITRYATTSTVIVRCYADLLSTPFDDAQSHHIHTNFSSSAQISQN